MSCFIISKKFQCAIENANGEGNVTDRTYQVLFVISFLPEISFCTMLFYLRTLNLSAQIIHVIVKNSVTVMNTTSIRELRKETFLEQHKCSMYVTHYG